MQGMGSVYVDFVNVGFGQCTVVFGEDKSYPVIVVDGGDDRNEIYDAPPYTHTLAQHLVQNNIGHIDLLAATHPHRDHVAGLDLLPEKIAVARFVSCFEVPGMPPLPLGKNSQDNMQMALWHYANVWHRLQKSGTELLEVGEREHIQYADGPVLDFYSPGATLMQKITSLYNKSYADMECASTQKLDTVLNAASMVVRLAIYGRRFLLTNDAPLCRWQELEQAEMGADVITAPHHGDAEQIDSFLMQKTGAEHVVVSAGGSGLYNLPTPNFAQHMRQLDVHNVWFTTGNAGENTAAGVRFTVRPGGTINARLL